MSSSVNAIKRYRTRKLASLIAKAYLLHRRHKDEQMYNLVCEEFYSLGGVYIKFLQGVLLRSEVMKRWHNPDKLKIFENLEHEPINIQAILRHELRPDQLAKIAGVQPQPFAAGSFGQVYYAQLTNGQPIVLKVLRPMVRELLRYDLRLLGAFTRRFFANLYKNVGFDLSSALRQFSEVTLRETDYKHEAEFAYELYEAYQNHSHLVVPKTYLELCTSNIIVQDYIGGLSVAQLIKLHEQGVDPKVYVKELLGSDLIFQLQLVGYELLTGIFKLERIQGDPHPGNIRLLPGNQVGLIDFGISADAPKERAALYGMIEAYDHFFKGSQTATGFFEKGLRFFVSDLYRSLKKMATFYSEYAQKDYVKEVGGIVQDAFVEVTGTPLVQADFGQEQSILALINGVVNKNNRFGLIMKLEATDILRALQTFTSLIGSLGLYREVVPATMSKVAEDVHLAYPEIASADDEQIAMGDAIETIANWLGRVAERDPVLFNQLIERIRGNAQASPESAKVMDIKE